MTAGSGRPVGLRWATLMMCLLNLAAFLYPRPARIGAGLFLAIVGVCASISFVVLWYFWRGRNWARWLVLATSVLAIVNLRLLESFGPFERILIVVNAALGAWLLYWLNTREVRAYFSRRAEADAA